MKGNPMTDPTPFSPGLTGPAGLQGPAGPSLSPEAHAECLEALRLGRIADDERRANVWWRKLLRALR
jgi:hypothetical protein